jgi:hypothetical protein
MKNIAELHGSKFHKLFVYIKFKIIYVILLIHFQTEILDQIIIWKIDI